MIASLLTGQGENRKDCQAKSKSQRRAQTLRIIQKYGKVS
jgi:hypothetical protein